MSRRRSRRPGFGLAGVEDASVAVDDGPDYEGALGGRDRDRAVVLLAHQSAQVMEAARYGVDLQLSGHTYGGRLWPFTHLTALATPDVAGLRGTGTPCST
ncbi:hypothetical protein ACIQVO_27730 [Streptomyces sp. NPDC101062]|uniref:hypothetical protein n=1 Tax=unclassified Streptomyces TaxID=2593676 RepID=UPI00382F7202